MVNGCESSLVERNTLCSLYFVLVYSFQGPSGPRGALGQQGERGQAGDPGERGESGSIGLPGPDVGHLRNSC